ncbi:flocculation protein FLO11 [Anarrhichthys ocellatus]|uniref:flocculation protein FLO11 n=1 Tax=Anarrhichthys ocellatus TaxID=433405 RepID=UPI0012EE6A7D|nr:reelin domain-containing protein 1 [Anarrhichthys ocellatus]
MIPGHIRAQPRDPKRVHVALRTSASSYLPGQFVTVTVQSSRDFMGFLLQARSLEGPGVGARTGARSTGVAPQLVGGSWTLTPPGTHTLRCLSEDDTLTHSDKQLKRNLSFVWRAPEGPMGDIRFYITVVQSYFVYWAGIESAVVLDGSRRPWTRSNISVVDGGNSALQEDEVTALPAHKASNKQTKQTASHAITLGPVSRPVSETNHLTNQVGNERKNRAIILGSNQNTTKGSENETYRTSGSVSGEAEEAGTDTGSSKDPKSSLQLTNHVPTTTAIPSTKHGFHDANLSRSTSQNPRETIQDQTRSVKFVTQSSSSQPWRTSESHTSLIKDEKGRQSVPRTQNLHLKPSLHSQTSSTKPLLHSQTGPSHIFPFFQEPSSMSRTSLSFILPSKTPTLQSFVKTQTTPPLSQAYSLSIHVFPIKPMNSLPQPENSPSGPKTRSRKTSPHQLRGSAPLSTTSPHPEPSPAPRRSLYDPLTSSTPIPSKQLTLGQRLPIQNHIESSDTEPNLKLQTPRTVVHPNPERHPNLDPNFDLNFGHMLKPNIPKTDTKPKPPSKPPDTPDKEGKYPDINARHSAWELGMLLGCSAGLGMVLVVGVRYMCRQACGKQTEVTLNDRETEYGRGERGLLHVQECGDLVRVRRIRENSFVLLAEYDVLPSPGD